MNKRLFRFCFPLLFLLVSFAVHAGWHTEEHSAMGTKISITVWSEDDIAAKKSIAAVMVEMQRIDQTYSPYIESSELSRLNRLAATTPQPVSDEMKLLLTTASKVSELTEGAFDITYASVGHLYDYRQKKQPNQAQREQKKVAIDYRLVVLEKNKVFFKHPGVVIDLGGIAKGYAADQAIAILQRYGIRHASFSAGGDSRLLGDRVGRPWLVGIENPRQQDSIAITLPLDNTAVSTSGDYERFFIDPQTGERVHHIINPRSGASAKGVASVTILGENGLDTDPLSTSVFVMGVEKGLALIDRLSGLDAIIIDSQGKVHYSKGLLPPER
ncbi:MAG: FAD:protein FMN transferase [Cellvibrionaceae bacterium]